MSNSSLNEPNTPEFVNDSVNIINMLRSNFENKQGLIRKQINIFDKYLVKYPKEKLEKGQWIKVQKMLTEIYLDIAVSQYNMAAKGEKIKDSEFKYYLEQLKQVEEML